MGQVAAVITKCPVRVPTAAAAADFPVDTFGECASSSATPATPRRKPRAVSDEEVIESTEQHRPDTRLREPLVRVGVEFEHQSDAAVPRGRQPVDRLLDDGCGGVGGPR